MKFEDCKVDMRVRGFDGNVCGKVGTIVGVNNGQRMIEVRWDDDSRYEPPRRYNMSIRFMEPIDPMERQRAETRAKTLSEHKTKSPDDVDRERRERLLRHVHAARVLPQVHRAAAVQVPLTQDGEKSAVARVKVPFMRNILAIVGVLGMILHLMGAV